MSQTEVVNLNREQLLQRAKQLQNELAQKRAQSTASLMPSTVSRYRIQQPHAAFRSMYSVSAGNGSHSSAVTHHNRQPHTYVRRSHNRVFVRKSPSSSIPLPESVSCVPLTGRSSPAESLLSVASSVASTKGSDEQPPLSSMLVSSPQSSSVISNSVAENGSHASSAPTGSDELPVWARAQVRLVIPVGGSSDDSDDQEDLTVKAHSAALHRILHPPKDLKRSQPQSQSVVFQSATKLVKHGALDNRLAAIKAASSRHKRTFCTEKINNIQASVVAVPDRSNQISPAIAYTESSIKKHNADQRIINVASRQASLSMIAVKPTIASSLRLASAQQRNGLRHISKFKLTTTASTKSSDLNNKTVLVNRHKLASFTTAASSGVLSSQRTTMSPMKTVVQSRFKFTRRTATTSPQKSARTLATNVTSTNGRTLGARLRQNLLMLRGVPFQTSKGGKVLKRINTSLHRKENPVIMSPTKQQSLRRLKTMRAVAGTIGRQGANAQTSNTESIVSRVVASQLVNRSIFKLNNKRRLQNGISSKQQEKEVKDCIFFIRFGKCHKGDACKFTHDPAKVSICTRFIRGTCKSSSCPFSHEVSADKMPLCSYFQRGQCTVQACPYRHSYFRKNVPYCLDFLNSFCTKGEKCTKQHVLVCTDPDCSQDPAKCPLRHKHSRGKENSQKRCSPSKKRRFKRVVVVSKDTSKEAWPEFVTLDNNKDRSVLDELAEGVEEVRVEMPCRSSTRRLKRFLERRARPVWPDYSEGLSAVRVESRGLKCLPGYSLRLIMKKARWMRRVPRPVRIPGEFISLDIAKDHGNEDSDIAGYELKSSKSQWAFNRRRSFDQWSTLSADEVSDDEYNADMLLKLGYGEPLTGMRRRENSVESELSVSSYTSPGSEYSSDEANTNMAPTQADANDWLLEYLYSLEKSPSPAPEPERLDHYGPIFEHWEFRTGDKIREAIDKFKRRKGTKNGMKNQVGSLVSVGTIGNEGGARAANEDYIPLWSQEEGEILSEDEVEGVDLDVVDMELDSETEDGKPRARRSIPRTSSIAEAEEISSDEEGLASEPEGNSADVNCHIATEAISDVEDISDVEEGEIF